MSSSADIVMAGKDKSAPGRRKPHAVGQAEPSMALPLVIGGNLRTLRTRQGHSLERLAKLAGVSRAMLSQIETGRSVPTILLLLKVANALAVPLATLVSTPAARRTTVLTRAGAKVVSASGGRFTLRALFASETTPRVEFNEVHIAARHTEQLDPHAAGAKEILLVVKGRIELAVGQDQPLLLQEGDAAQLHADVPRSLRNPDASEAVLHQVVSFIGTSAG
jgi:transcriptional regulator with XRE-family HTH domain